MLKDLTPDQKALEHYMSELSELAFSARWMGGLEFGLWEVAYGERREYGRLTCSSEHVARLRVLAEACGGWIVFDEEMEETWVSRAEWERRLAVPKHGAAS